MNIKYIIQLTFSHVKSVSPFKQTILVYFRIIRTCEALFFAVNYLPSFMIITKKERVKFVKLNPHLKISIGIDEDQKEWLEIMKQEFKNRFNKNDCFSLYEDEQENLTLFFSPSIYTCQKGLRKRLEENAMKRSRSNWT